MDESMHTSIGDPAAESTLVFVDRPPLLQVSAPADEMEITDVDLPPPVLERSVPLSLEDVGPQSLDVSEPLQPLVLEPSLPVQDENEADDEDSPSLQQHDATVMLNATYVVPRDDSEMSASSSFDISHRDVDDTLPIEEEPVTEEPVLTDTIVEEEPLHFKIVEQGSQRGRQLLVDSLGYSYGVKARYTSSIIWRCSVRTKSIKCPVTVKQFGDRFKPGNVQHIHPADPGRLLKAEVTATVKQDAVGNMFRPAMDIIDDAMLEKVSPNDVIVPKKALMKRVANRFRAKKRPQEPRDFDFQVNQDYLQCEDFLIGDIRVGDYLHFIFATEKQLSLLRAAKRWYMDGTFKVLSDPWKRQGQLFSIHAFIEKDGQSQQFPLAFCIMSRKTIADYKEVFRVLMDKIGSCRCRRLCC